MLDTVRMANIVDWDGCPKAFHSLNRLLTVHAELMVNMGFEVLQRKIKIPERFKDPPFAGTEDIVPLMTPADMFREGRQQRNCVGWHVIPVAEGGEYVYRVERPVRATLSVILKHGTWVPDECCLAGNKPIDPGIRQQVLSALFSSRRIPGNNMSRAESSCKAVAI